jgi:hypothetical protein
LFRQHLIEGLLLTAIGAFAGLLLARWGVDVLVAFAPAALSRLEAAQINGPVIAFSLAVVFTWGVLLSVAPLSEVWRVHLVNAIRIDAARTGVAGQGLRTLLISIQIAMSVVLVVGANDVVNPAARQPGTPISGMPIINVDQAQSVVFLKRSMRPGFAGIENELLYDDKTQLLFGDAKDSLAKTVTALKAL